jgi:hypothetical protein
MMASRGMGDVNPAKIRTVRKKDGNEPVGVYKKGGMAKEKFIQEAIKKPGALRKSLGAKKGEPIPAKKLAKAAKAPGKLGQRARFAEVLKGLKK